MTPNQREAVDEAWRDVLEDQADADEQEAWLDTWEDYEGGEIGYPELVDFIASLSTEAMEAQLRLEHYDLTRSMQPPPAK